MPRSPMRSPAIDSTAVVLPAPLGPRTPKISPCSTAKLTPSTAVLSPYRLWRSVDQDGRTICVVNHGTSVALMTLRRHIGQPVPTASTDRSTRRRQRLFGCALTSASKRRTPGEPAARGPDQGDDRGREPHQAEQGEGGSARWTRYRAASSGRNAPMPRRGHDGRDRLLRRRPQRRDPQEQDARDHEDRRQQEVQEAAAGGRAA